MKRDMDFIRDLLLRIEGGEKSFETTSSSIAMLIGAPSETCMNDEEADRLKGHLELLDQGGMIEVHVLGSAGLYLVKDLTWKGHDFLDSVRDPKIWERTKKGAEVAGGFTAELLLDLAKGFIRKQIEDRTGVKL